MTRHPDLRYCLRIEDIDKARMLPDADRWIMDDLNWLGLNWDGEPVYQSQRMELYEHAFEALGNRVYPCFCSRADVKAASAPQGDGFSVYPGTCRRLLREHPDTVRERLRRGARHSLRLAMPDEHEPEATLTLDDRVFGRCRWNLARDIGDPVMRRSDGVFAYQMAVTVDDLDMGITQIVRGRDLLRSAALQLWIRRLLQAQDPDDFGGSRSSPSATPSRPDPTFAHIPLIDDPSGRRLAKRERAVDMGTLRAHGLTPRQVIGYCAWLLGVRVRDDRGRENARPVPMSVNDVSQVFTWDVVRRDRDDRKLSWRLLGM